MRELLTRDNFDSVIDLGSGPGFIKQALAGVEFSYLGYEYSSEILDSKIGQKFVRLDLTQGVEGVVGCSKRKIILLLCNLPWADFDVACSKRDAAEMVKFLLADVYKLFPNSKILVCSPVAEYQTSWNETKFSQSDFDMFGSYLKSECHVQVKYQYIKGFNRSLNFFESRKIWLFGLIFYFSTRDIDFCKNLYKEKYICLEIERK